VKKEIGKKRGKKGIRGSSGNRENKYMYDVKGG